MAKAKDNDMGNDIGDMGGILPKAIYCDITEIHDTHIVHGDTSITIR